ncbi:uncharacterized protein JCM10292_007740 [Rhodotorula paludigena]|uniref:uncharacterized protein n=1 Tax=Rhodotorula paludigena TaxID=86838 RepID=UPI00317020CA
MAERSASPTPSTRDLIRSYTTSSDSSAAERIAAAREAREQRRREREEGVGRKAGNDLPVRGRSSAEVHEADSQDGRSSLGGVSEVEGGAWRGEDGEDGTRNSLVPKLRVRPTSDRSYTPTVPSTPSRSLPSSSSDASPSSSLPGTAAIQSPYVAKVTTPRRQSFEVAQIPPFRPKTASPAPSAAPASPASAPSTPEPARTPSPSHVALAGGLMERLKAQRAAKAAADGRTVGEAAGSVAAGGLDLSPPVVQPPTSEAGSSVPKTPVTQLFELQAEPSSPLTPALEEPAPTKAAGQAGLRDGQYAENARPRARSPVQQTRRTVLSRIIDRDGQEHDFEFTQLSDVPEQTERSSISTWHDSPSIGHRRHASTSTTEHPLTSARSLAERSFAAEPRRFSLASSYSGRQQADGTFSHPARTRPLIPSSWSAITTSTSPSSPHDRLDPSTDNLPVDQRVDATSHLLGRNGSTSSIFPASSRSSAASTRSNVQSPSAVSSSSDTPRRSASPPKRISPELARRVAPYERSDSATAASSPRDSLFSSTTPSSPVKRARVEPDTSSISSSTSSRQVVEPVASATTSTTTTEEGDPLVAIERRRTQRKAALAAFRAQLAAEEGHRAETSKTVSTTASASPSAGPSRKDGHLLELEDSQPLPPVPSSRSGETIRSLAALPILHEGYLRMPSMLDDPAAPQDWVRRYCVLTADSLDVRPTDLDPLVKPSTLFRLTECLRVEDQTLPTSSADLRPFAAVLVDGEKRLFACENRVRRVQWIMALQDAINARAARQVRPAAARKDSGFSSVQPPHHSAPATAHSTRTLTPPGSVYSETRGTIRREDLRKADQLPPTPPLGLYSYADDELRPSSASLPGAPAPRDEKVDSRQPCSIGSDRSLPPAPTKTYHNPATFLDGRGHWRSRSDLAAYNTPDDQPPFRPTPTRPSSTSSSTSAPLSPRKHHEVASSRSSSSITPVPQREPVNTKARAMPDNATLTTRAGIHSASEKLDWERDLRRFKDEARATDRPPASSAASPNTVLRERERASRKLQNLSPLSPDRLEPFTSSGALFDEPFAPGPSRARDPFAGSGVVEPSAIPAALPKAPPSNRSFGDWRSRSESGTAISWAASDVSKVEQALFRILDNFEQQNGLLAHNQVQQDRVAQVIGELAKWVAEDRSLRDAQFSELVGAVNGVVQHVSDLPQRLLSSLQTAEPARPSSAPLPTVDRPEDEKDEVQDDAHLDDVSKEDPADGAAHGGSGTVKKRGIGINPLSSFAQLDRRMATGEAAATSKPKGPRMPGIRLWGAPAPVADRVNRWGGGAVQAKAVADQHDLEQALLDDAAAGKPRHGPVVDVLAKDEKLGQALEAIANGSADDVDAGTLSLAVFEILQTMREISQKQVAQEAKERAEREKNSGLTLKELAELEAKRAEIGRLERETAMNAERTARINEMVAQLAEKTEKADELLNKIAKDVQDGKTTTMDPALSAEVKKLLGGVRAGVDDHVKDFRSQLTSEVQRMFKEVGKLRDEKKTLQADIAELMAFQAKQGGTLAAKPVAAHSPPAAPSPAEAAPEPPKPGMPTSGFFGPRAMK